MSQFHEFLIRAMRLKPSPLSLGSIIMDLEDNIFMLAGPVKMHPRVLRAMASPAINHRSAEFKAINAEKMGHRLEAGCVEGGGGSG